jgi:hypothetical protein
MSRTFAMSPGMNRRGGRRDRELRVVPRGPGPAGGATDDGDGLVSTGGSNVSASRLARGSIDEASPRDLPDAGCGKGG